MISWVVFQSILNVVLERLIWIGFGIIIVFGWLERNTWALPHIRRFVQFIIQHRPGYKKEKQMREISSKIIEIERNITDLQKVTDSTSKILEAGNNYDILNEIKKIQDQLIENHNDLKMIFNDVKMSRAKQTIIENGLNIISFATDSKGYCTDVSTAYLQMTGMTLEELTGFGWKNAVAEEDMNRVSQLWNECVSEGRNFLAEITYKNIITGERYDTVVDARVVRSKNVIIGWEGIITKLN